MTQIERNKFRIEYCHLKYAINNTLNWLKEQQSNNTKRSYYIRRHFR